jgi:AcrR family transcriptional regulator
VSERPNRADNRADRILDAAAELLLRHGYRKVTIEDIARQAGIGKGTVYLHWRTKEVLFDALLLRESIDLFEELLEALRHDPTEIALHRFERLAFLASNRRPLMRAVITRDSELLGKRRNDSLRSLEVLVTERFFELMIGHGLVRDDIPNLPYALGAVSTGFYLVDVVDPEAAQLDMPAKADALAHTIRHAFEPAAEPDRAALVTAASEITSLLEDLIASYRKWIYSHDPTQPGPN